MSRLALAAVATFALLAGCGGDDEESEGDLPTSNGTGIAATASAAPEKVKACGDAMTAALSKAYDESKDLPAADRDLAFAAAAGELPAECKGLNSQLLLGLLEVAKEKAIPDPG